MMLSFHPAADRPEAEIIKGKAIIAYLASCKGDKAKWQKIALLRQKSGRISLIDTRYLKDKFKDRGVKRLRRIFN
jgi:hypothetical protein